MDRKFVDNVMLVDCDKWFSMNRHGVSFCQNVAIVILAADNPLGKRLHYYRPYTRQAGFKPGLHSTRRSRRVYADIYAISVAYHFREMDLFYMSRKSLRIRIGCGLLANDNPASTRKRRRIVGVFILGTCAIPTA